MCFATVWYGGRQIVLFLPFFILSFVGQRERLISHLAGSVIGALILALYYRAVVGPKFTR